jgi:hypothetical protein
VFNGIAEKAEQPDQVIQKSQDKFAQLDTDFRHLVEEVAIAEMQHSSGRFLL